jgi:carboxymethylenebutenolidase
VSFLTVPEAPDPDAAGVLILPDVRGLHPFYVELAERFARAGHPATAIDYTAEVLHTSVEEVQAGALAARDALRERGGDRPVVAVGFSSGGMQALLAATSPELDLAGVVAFSGTLDGAQRGLPSPADRATAMRCPVLALFGADDRSIPQDQIAGFGRALQAAGVDHHILVYPGAPHSFFDRASEKFPDASDDAWQRALAFVQRSGAAR